MSEMASTPRPPYFAVIFTSRRAGGDLNRYVAAVQRMEELATEQPGFLGSESARSSSGLGISISYWRTLESIQAWRRNAEHVVAQKQGRESWYAEFTVRVARVERQYGSDEWE